MVLDLVYIVLALLTKIIPNNERKERFINQLFTRYMNCDINHKNVVNETYDILSDSEAVESVFKFGT